MKKKIRNTILAFVGTILGVVIIATAVLLITGKMAFHIENGKLVIVIDSTNGEDDTYNQVIKASKSTYPTDIFVYGEDCGFREAVEFTSITAFTDEQLQSDKEVKLIVINDLKGQIKFTEKDLEILKKYIYENRYIFLYLGIEQYDEFVEAEILQKEEVLGNIEGLAVRHVGDTIIQTSGIWDEEGNTYYQNGGDELLGQVIFLYLRTCYGEM